MVLQSVKTAFRSSTAQVGLASALVCSLITMESAAREIQFHQLRSEHADASEANYRSHSPNTMTLAQYAGDCGCGDHYDDDYDEYVDDYEEDYDDYVDDRYDGYDDDYADGQRTGYSNERTLSSAKQRMRRVTDHSAGVVAKQIELMGIW